MEKIQTMAEIDKNYPASVWSHVFIDEAAENVTINGSCGIYIRQPCEPSHTRYTRLEKCA